MFGYKLSKKKTKESSVTIDWGVKWSPEFIARDILQNFRDANKESIEKIKIKTKASEVLIEASAVFDLEELFYLGSNKGADDIGQFGEGFKAAVVSLFKIHEDAKILAVSGNKAVEIRLGKKTRTGKQPLAYDFYSIKDTKCSRVHISGIDSEMQNAFKDGLRHFWYSKNKLLGKMISDDLQSFEIYKSNDEDGYIFYRGLMRATIPGVPIVLSTDRQLKSIEKAIGQDRDRLNFNEKVLKQLINAFKRDLQVHAEDPDDIMEIILKLGKSRWETGSPIFSAMADFSRTQNNWDNFCALRNAKKIFGDKYYSEMGKTYGHEDTPKWYQTESKLKKNRTKLPAYFTYFGVHSGRTKFEANRREAYEKEKEKGIKAPTRAQAKKIDYLMECMRSMCETGSHLSKYFEDNTVYQILQSDSLLGELEEHENKRYTVFLSKSIFKSSFGHAMSVFLHEHSHCVGYDGQREFSDLLTKFIESSIDGSKKITKMKKGWK